MSDQKPGQGPAAVADPAEKEERSEEREEEQRDEKPVPTEKERLEQARKAQEKISEDHPRFKDVYAKMKSYEAQLSERDKDLEAVREYNMKMAARLEELAKTKEDRKEAAAPDPAVDPDGYRKWHEHQLARKDKEYQEKLTMELRAVQVDTMQSIHDDYDDMVKVAIRDMQRDPALEAKINNSRNAPKAAYEYGKKKMDELKTKEEKEKDRKEHLDQGAVERDSPAPPAKEEPTLSEAERRVVRNLFPEMSYKDAEKKYLAQKKAMGR